jgi:hypothetical protein
MPEESKGKRIPEKIVFHILDKNAVTVAVAAFFLSAGKVIKKSDFRFKIHNALKKEKTEE